MKRIETNWLFPCLMAVGFAAGCNGDVTSTDDTEGTDDGEDTMMMTTVPMTTAGDTADSGDTGMTDDDATDDAPMTDGMTESDDGFIPVPVDMFFEITNVSGDAVTLTPISPGLWANHEDDATLFYDEDITASEGLEMLAEDGDPSTLLTENMGNGGILLSGTFDTPEGAGGPAPLMPGETYRVEFTAEPFSRLSMAFMIVGSNDWFIGTAGVGLGLFAGGGQAQGVRDVTDSLRVWDAGTEGNQGPSQGPWQALHSGTMTNIGAPEIDPGVFPHTDSTRAIPLPIDLLSVEVDQGDGVKVPAEDFTITITNTSYERGTLVTPFSDLWYMTHDDTVTMFDTGAAASLGIENLAEDGNPAELETAFNGAAGVGLTGSVAGPFAPGDGVAAGDTITITFTADPDFPLLSFATMVVESNDAFLAPPPAGIMLYDEDGDLRDDEDIEEDIVRLLTVWDAGTEVNEVPGAGINQVLRQADVNTGPADADTNVRIYADEGDDTTGPYLGGMIDVVITESTMGGGGDFIVHIENVSDLTGYPAAFTPVFWMTHDNTVTMFETGSLASAGLESLAEDGDAATLLTEFAAGAGGVGTSGVYDVPEDMGGALVTGDPILPGEFYEFTVTPTAAERFFNFATMVVPSNDTFAAFGSTGVALLDNAGAPRTDEAIAADVMTELQAWDAGTEANQAGGAGRDQAPRQAAVNTGQGNGSGLVRRHEDGPSTTVIWSAPEPHQVVQVMVGPVGG